MTQGCIGLKQKLPKDLKTSTLLVVEDVQLSDAVFFKKRIKNANRRLEEKFESYPYSYQIVPANDSIILNSLRNKDTDTFGHVYILSSGESLGGNIIYTNGMRSGTYTQVFLKEDSTGKKIFLMKAKNGIYGGASLFIRKVKSMK